MRARRLLATLALPLLLATGCYTGPTTTGYAAYAAQPRPVWVQGHWYWDPQANRWAWRDGYYAAAPAAPQYDAYDAYPTYVASPRVYIGTSWWWPYYGRSYFYGGRFGHHFGHGGFRFGSHRHR